MRLMVAAAIALVLPGLAAAQSADRRIEELRGAAMRGDYQAQRNLAFVLGSRNELGSVKDARMACAWRIVIVLSGHKQTDMSDLSNLRQACFGITDQFSQAQSPATELLAQIGVERFKPIEPAPAEAKLDSTAEPLRRR